MQASVRLYDLQEHIRRVLALNFSEAIWLNCEIAQCNKSRGHYYLSLVEKGEDETIIARAEAVLWAKTYRKLRRKLGLSIDQVLQDGMSVQFHVRVDFHEQYGLKLQIEDLDLTHTIGAIELKRRANLETLTQLNILDQNAQLPLPQVLQRIAVLSSERAAGWEDFRAQLEQNEYHYRFQLTLFPTAMQGAQVVPEMLQRFRGLAQRTAAFDAIVIIRGGGARLDLQAFDDLELCKAIAAAQLPVLTGIGHEIDEALADKVAHTSLKTPTAVANFILEHNSKYESKMVELSWEVQQLAKRKLQAQAIQLVRLETELQLTNRQYYGQERLQLEQLQQQLQLASQRQVHTREQELESLANMHELLSVERTLARGFTLTTKVGKIIQDSKELQVGETITTHFKDGTIDSKIEK